MWPNLYLLSNDGDCRANRWHDDKLHIRKCALISHRAADWWQDAIYQMPMFYNISNFFSINLEIFRTLIGTPFHPKGSLSISAHLLRTNTHTHTRDIKKNIAKSEQSIVIRSWTIPQQFANLWLFICDICYCCISRAGKPGRNWGGESSWMPYQMFAIDQKNRREFVLLQNQYSNIPIIL